MARTFYDVLGVSVGATSDELRQAYRERARVLHPDRLQASGAGSPGVLGTGMAEVNEAWRVLRDPAARAAYDRALAGAALGPGTPAPFDGPVGFDGDDGDQDIPFQGRSGEPGDVLTAVLRALPWLIVGLVLGGIFVFTAFAAGGGDPSPRQLVGDCVRASSSLLEVVPCTGAEDDEVVAVVHSAAECPTGTKATPSGRDRILCLRPFAGASP
jgi:curved DNA-binding protein CbpA